MRASGVLILVVVISMAVVVILQSRDVTAKREAVTAISAQLREEGVEATRFDPDRARRVIDTLEGLVADPAAIEFHVDDLRTISETASRWAAGAASPSPELHASVAIRSATGELRSYAVRPSQPALDKAGRELERARHALAVGESDDGTTAPSGLVTEGIRDQLNNLEASQKERALELEEDLNR